MSFHSRMKSDSIPGLQSFAIGESPSQSEIAAPRESAWRRYILPALAAGLLWFILCRHLSSEWSLNEQYSYGWFVPFFAAYLFWLRWENRPARELHSRPSWLALGLGIVPALLLLPVRLFEVGNPDWRPLGWVHAGCVVTLTFLALYQAAGWPWVKHFSFPVCFIFVAVPWVSGIEQQVIQTLMRSVAAVAAETLNLCGVPAQVEGNLIRITSGLVGVNEACSGVRSLQTSLMIGLLFGELKRLSLVRRLFLLGGAVAIALIANCARAVLLVWLAGNSESGSITRWHDVAGYSIVVIVFIGTMILAVWLGKAEARRKVDSPANDRPTVHAFSLLPSAFCLSLLAWLVFTEIAVELWYRLHECNLIIEKNWSVDWPEHAPSFRAPTIDEGVRRTLRFDDGSEATWMIPASSEASANPQAMRAYAFFFRWNAGGSSVVRARAHRPDICLPSAGWDALPERGTAEYRVGDLLMPFRRGAYKREGLPGVAYTFFCLQEDRRRLNEERPDLLVSGGAQPDWSLPGRTRVVRNGVRNLGQQVLEIVLLSPEPLDDTIVDDRFSALLQGVVRPAPPEKKS